jgi:hypothetical protein
MTTTQPAADADHHHNRGAAEVGSAESSARVHGGPPVLDIGGNIGALVATMDPDMAGTELHLRSEHQLPIDIHTGVWHRSVNGTTTTAAVFAELIEGTYWVLDPTGTAIRPVTIRGGELAGIDLRRITKAHPR